MDPDRERGAQAAMVGARERREELNAATLPRRMRIRASAYSSCWVSPISGGRSASRSKNTSKKSRMADGVLKPKRCEWKDGLIVSP